MTWALFWFESIWKRYVVQTILYVRKLFCLKLILKSSLVCILMRICFLCNKHDCFLMGKNNCLVLELPKWMRFSGLLAVHLDLGSTGQGGDYIKGTSSPVPCPHRQLHYCFLFRGCMRYISSLLVLCVCDFSWSAVLKSGFSYNF